MRSGSSIVSMRVFAELPETRDVRRGRRGSALVRSTLRNSFLGTGRLLFLSPSLTSRFLAKTRRYSVFLFTASKTGLQTLHPSLAESLHQEITVGAGSCHRAATAVKLKMDSAKTSFTPEVITERIGISYRFKFPGSGLFQCSLTGLMFNVTHESEVAYKTLIWDNMCLQPACKVAGGPLFSIECPQDTICQLHLPHCEPEPALVSKSLSVVQITDDSMSIIQPMEITATHVVVDTPHISAFGIVWDLIKRFKNFMVKPISGQILLFLQPPHRGGTLILSVILLPSNVPLQEVKAQYENCECIQAPSYCLLHKDQHYSLHSDPEDYNIQPPFARFFQNYGPNYHASLEIFLTSSTEEVNLMVRDPERTQVWEYDLHLPASSSPSSSDENQPRMGSNTSAEENL